MRGAQKAPARTYLGRDVVAVFKVKEVNYLDVKLVKYQTRPLDRAGPGATMGECTYCRAINISELTPFAGLSRNFSFNDLGQVPSQLHHPSLKSLRASAQSCSGCALFLDGLTAGQRRGRIPGVLLKHVGADDFGDDPWDPSLEEKPVVLRGLGREGYTHERKQLYGILAQCDTALNEFGLFADEGQSHGRLIQDFPRDLLGCRLARSVPRGGRRSDPGANWSSGTNT
jgi:hypothetical protein